MGKILVFIACWLILPQLPRLLGWGASNRRRRDAYPRTGWARVNHATGFVLGLVIVAAWSLGK